MQREERNEVEDVPVFFSLGVEYMNFSMFEGLFDVDFSLITVSEGFVTNLTSITMEPCTISHL